MSRFFSTAPFSSGVWPIAAIFASAMCAFLFMATPANAATTEGAVISNGTVQLGVNAQGDLNYDCVGAGDTGCPDLSVREQIVGLRYVPLNLDAISPGCRCEGWGLADAGSGLTGSANESVGDSNITIDSFNATATTSTSTVTISDPSIPGSEMEIVQFYHPSPLSSNLYVDTVTVTNTGANTLTDLRYRRAMDWDVEPTAFSEWVTIQGTSPQVLFDSDDGFASSDPLSGPSYIDSETSCGTGIRGPVSSPTSEAAAPIRPTRPPMTMALSSTSALDSSLPGIEVVQHLLRRRRQRGGGDCGARRRRRTGLLAGEIELHRRHNRDLFRPDGKRRSRAGQAGHLHVRVRDHDWRPLDHQG